MNELFLQRVKEYFKDDADAYLQSLNKPCTQAFFLNTEKASREEILSLIDFPYEGSVFTKDSFYHHNDNIGKSRAYELGLIYPQEIAASLTSAFVNTEDVNLIIDLCAAPGGKTINILNRVRGNAICICNDVSHSRALTLSSNLERLGLDRVVVTNKKCEDLADQLEEKADIVILDAPCSGEGMIRKYPEILDTYSLKNIENLAQIQSDLLEQAYRILKQGGQLIYSTCTYAFEEDEDQIISFLSRHEDMKLCEINMPSFSKLKGTVKLCPLNDTEGQFFAMLEKDGAKEKTSLSFMKSTRDKTVEDFIRENLILNEYELYQYNGHFYLSLKKLPDLKNGILKCGIYLGDVVKKRFEPAHDLYRANSLKGKFRYTYDLNDDEYLTFISGNQLKADLEDHYYQITYRGHSLGYGKSGSGYIKNKYPKGLRRMI